MHNTYSICHFSVTLLASCVLLSYFYYTIITKHFSVTIPELSPLSSWCSYSIQSISQSESCWLLRCYSKLTASSWFSPAIIALGSRLAACDCVTWSDTAAGGGGHRGFCKRETQKTPVLMLSGCHVTRAQWGRNTKRSADKARDWYSTGGMWWGKGEGGGGIKIK